jgi:hypothetical protein
MHREMDVFGIHSSGISGNQIVNPCMGDLDHFWILLDWLRFPGYKGHSGENLRMHFRLNPTESEGVKYAKETACHEAEKERVLKFGHFVR